MEVRRKMGTDKYMLVNEGDDSELCEIPKDLKTLVEGLLGHSNSSEQFLLNEINDLGCDDLEGRIEELESKIEDSECRIEELESKIEDSECRIEELEKELKELKKDVIQDGC